MASSNVAHPYEKYEQWKADQQRREAALKRNKKGKPKITEVED